MNYCQSLFDMNPKALAKSAFFEVDTGAVFTFDALRESIVRWSTCMKSRGVKPGDVVAIHLYNSIDFILAHMAAQYLGAVSCLLDPLSQPKSIPYLLEESKSSILITHLAKEQIPSQVSEYCSLLSTEILKSEAQNVQIPEEFPQPYCWDSETTCFIYFTSGTTSLPKGVALTPSNHKNFFRIAEQYWTPSDETSKHLCFVPFSHGFGSVFLIPWTIKTGSELHIMRSFHPSKVAETIEKIGITHIYGVPSHYEQLLRFPQFHPALKKLTMAFCAAAKLEGQTGAKWKEVTGTRLHEGYGLIETTGGVVWRVHQDALCTGHVGECPDPSLIEVSIMDENDVILPPDSEGEIVIRGKSVTKGYLNKPEENLRVFHNGWFRTGDRGFISTDRQLFMTGRIKDIINIAGIKISPYEVEAVLNDHPDVEISIVTAAEDPLYGEIVKAFVIRKNDVNLTERELIKYAGTHLINFQVPKIIQFVEQFPLNSMGKVDRKALRTV